MNHKLLFTLLTAGLALNSPSAIAQNPGKKYAVLVGVSEYQHDKLKKLRFTENDAAELADVLRNAGYDVKLLTDSEGKKTSENAPTKANIDKAIADTLTKCQKADTVVIALAGHGLQFQDKPDSYFCPREAKPFVDEIKTLVSVTQIYSELEKSLAGVKVLLVDACRDDPTATRGATRGIDADTAPRPPRGVAALFSCSAGEVSYEHDRYQHGVFFHFVLEGLRKEAKERTGEVTFDGLSKYVREHVAREVPRLIGGGAKQSPNLKADLSGASPVLLGHYLTNRRPNMGIFYAQMSRAEAAKVELKPLGQIRVHYVVHGAAGDRFGLQVGDVFLRINQHQIHNIVQVNEAFGKLEFGTPTEFVVLRGKEEKIIRGQLEPSFGLVEMIRKLQTIAEQGDAGAQLFLAYTLQQANSSLSNPAESIKWLRKAADQGDMLATSFLANCLQSGIGTPKDPVEAAKLFRVVAESGRSHGAYRYGYCLEGGIGLEKNLKEAVKWYREAAEQSHPDAILRLAHFAASGIGMPKNPAEAFALYQRAAEMDNSDAFVQIGMAHFNGSGTAKNETEAMKAFRRAADLGNSAGATKVGIMYFFGSGVAKDVKESIRWFEKGAELGNVDAMMRLGNIYYYAQGIDGDRTEAARWYQRAAARNSADAQYKLGFMYLRGQGVVKDEAAGFALLQKADAQHHAEAKKELGRCFELGIGTTMNKLEAVSIYKQAAEQGNRLGQFNLAVSLLHGNGVAANPNEAFQWFRKAADQKHARSEFFMGENYELGRGVEKNQSEAIRWYRRAAVQGDTFATNALKRLNVSVNPQ